MKLKCLRLEPVTSSPCPPLQPDVRGRIQKHHHIGAEPLGRRLRHHAHHLQAQAVTVALIGNGGGHISIADYRLAARQRGVDHLLQQLCPRGGEEEQPGAWRHIDSPLEDTSHPLAEHGSAGLVGQQPRMALPAQTTVEATCLGGLATTLASLKDDEGPHSLPPPRGAVDGHPAVLRTPVAGASEIVLLGEQVLKPPHV